MQDQSEKGYIIDTESNRNELTPVEFDDLEDDEIARAIHMAGGSSKEVQLLPIVAKRLGIETPDMITEIGKRTWFFSKMEREGGYWKGKIIPLQRTTSQKPFKASLFRRREVQPEEQSPEPTPVRIPIERVRVLIGPEEDGERHWRGQFIVPVESLKSYQDKNEETVEKIDLSEYQERIKLALTKEYSEMMADFEKISKSVEDRIKEIESKYPNLYYDDWEQGGMNVIKTFRRTDMVSKGDQNNINSLSEYGGYSSEMSIHDNLEIMTRNVEINFTQKEQIESDAKVKLEEEWYRMASILEQDKPLKTLFENRLKDSRVSVKGVFSVNDKWGDITKTLSIFKDCVDLQKRVRATNNQSS